MSPARLCKLLVPEQYTTPGMVNKWSRFPQRDHTLLQMQIVINNIIDINYR